MRLGAKLRCLYLTQGRETESHGRVEQENTESGGHLRILERWIGWGETRGKEARRRLSSSPGEVERHPLRQHGDDEQPHSRNYGRSYNCVFRGQQVPATPAKTRSSRG